MTKTIALLAALTLLGLFLHGARDYLRAVRDRKARRASYFAALSPKASRIEPSGFPRATVIHQGHSFDLQAVPDTLSFRKLPCLWLLVTLTEPQPVTAETRIMARASGLEPFSTFANLPVTLALPPGFPPDCSLRTTDPGALPDLAPLAPFFTHPRVKELTLSPKGLRLVVLAEEAPRTAYLLYREAELPQEALDPAKVHALMDQLISLSKDIPPQGPTP